MYQLSAKLARPTAIPVYYSMIMWIKLYPLCVILLLNQLAIYVHTYYTHQLQWRFESVRQKWLKMIIKQTPQHEQTGNEGF